MGDHVYKECMVFSFQIQAQISLKRRVYPLFSFWILMALALLLPHSHKPRKVSIVLGGKLQETRITQT